MSDTPRNDELNRQTAGYTNARHLVLVDELSRKLERELAAMTKDRDALRREVAALVGAIVEQGRCVVHRQVVHPPCSIATATHDQCMKCLSDWAKQAAQAGKESTP